MKKNTPKLILKIKLIRDTDILFKIVSVTNVYTNSHGSKFFYTKNNWTIYNGNVFSINSKKIMSIPNNVGAESKVVCGSDNDRKEFLNTLVRALLDWSNQPKFRKSNLFNKPNIKFGKSLWVVY